MLPTTTSTTLKLQSDTTLLLDGPAAVRLKTGEAACLGGSLLKGIWIIVRSGRRIPIEAQSTSQLDLRLGTDASFKQLPGSTIPVSWREAGQIVRQTRGRIVILGNVDSGKSTLSNLLLNESLVSNLTVGMIDGDIGQPDIGPPTTISGAILEGPTFDLQTVTSQASYFVGDTSPGNVTGKVWSGLTMVQHRLSGSDVLVVNTDGWLDGPDAYKNKQGVLERIRPNLILAISDDPDEDQQGTLESLLDSQECTVLKLERPEYARKRSREERKRARETGYRRFLEGSARMTLDQDQIIVKRFDSEQAILELPSNDSFHGLLSGLLDEDGLLIGICRVIDTARKKVSVETAVRDVMGVRVLELGAIVLSSDYEEVGFSSHM